MANTHIKKKKNVFEGDTSYRVCPLNITLGGIEDDTKLCDNALEAIVEAMSAAYCYAYDDTFDPEVDDPDEPKPLVLVTAYRVCGNKFLPIFTAASMGKDEMKAELQRIQDNYAEKGRFPMLSGAKTVKELMVMVEKPVDVYMSGKATARQKEALVARMFNIENAVKGINIKL